MAKRKTQVGLEALGALKESLPVGSVLPPSTALSLPDGWRVERVDTDASPFSGRAASSCARLYKADEAIYSSPDIDRVHFNNILAGLPLPVSVLREVDRTCWEMWLTGIAPQPSVPLPRHWTVPKVLALEPAWVEEVRKVDVGIAALAESVRSEWEKGQALLRENDRLRKLLHEWDERNGGPTQLKAALFTLSAAIGTANLSFGMAPELREVQRRRERSLQAVFLAAKEGASPDAALAAGRKVVEAEFRAMFGDDHKVVVEYSQYRDSDGVLQTEENRVDCGPKWVLHTENAVSKLLSAWEQAAAIGTAEYAYKKELRGPAVLTPVQAYENAVKARQEAEQVHNLRTDEAEYAKKEYEATARTFPLGNSQRAMLYASYDNAKFKTERSFRAVNEALQAEADARKAAAVADPEGVEAVDAAKALVDVDRHIEWLDASVHTDNAVWQTVVTHMHTAVSTAASYTYASEQRAHGDHERALERVREVEKALWQRVAGKTPRAWARVQHGGGQR